MLSDYFPAECRYPSQPLSNQAAYTVLTVDNEHVMPIRGPYSVWTSGSTIASMSTSYPSRADTDTFANL